MELFAAFDHGSFLADLHDGDPAVAGKFVQGFPGRELGVGAGFRLVGKDNIHVVFHQIMEKGGIGFHHVVGGHVDGNDAPGLAGEPGRLGNQVLVLDQITLDMEIIVAGKLFRSQVVRAQFERCAHVISKGPFGVGTGDEDHAPAAGLGPVEHLGAYSVLFHRALEQVAEVVIADFPEESRLHAENGGAGDGVGGRPAGHILDPILLERFPDPVSGLHVHMLHAAPRKMVFLQEGLVRQDGEDVSQGISDAEDGFHISPFLAITYKVIQYLVFSTNFAIL